MEEPRRLGGRYELGGVLGRGGMAEVYIGHDIRLGRAVAVKTLRADMARDPSFQARFRREAQSAASLNHPSIVAVYDTGEDYIDGISIPYIVMEYVDGSTLRELLHSGRRLLPERAMEMCIGILQALEYSHRNGIVHRDIKPANVMLTRTGQVKVMDFGIARAMGDAGMTMTQTAAVIGTAQYLSPEQAKGEQVDARSDLYSTGCLLYELLTVRPPFVGDSPVAVAYQHVREEANPPSFHDPELRPEYDAIVMKALAKDREYRYQSADEMRADIERALDGLPVAAASAPTMAFGMNGYGQQPQADQYGRTMAMPPVPGGHGAPGGQTSILPGSGQGYDAGGDGYDPGSGYDDEYDNGYSGGRGDRRRAAQGGGGRNRNTSVIVLIVAAVLVLLGAFFVTKSMFNGQSNTTMQAPSLTGQSFADAQTLINNQFNGKVHLVKGQSIPCDANTADKGKVCKQDPVAGSTVQDGGTITVQLSTGPLTDGVPSLAGMTVDQATSALQAKGFQIGQTTDAASATVPKGQIISWTPQGNQPKGTTVDVTVSSGQALVQVPYLVGTDYQAACQQIEALHLNCVRGFAQANDPTQPAGNVLTETYQGQPVAQDGSTQVPAGSTITITANPQAAATDQGQTGATTGTPGIIGGTNPGGNTPPGQGNGGNGG
ncbi:Stk1 family PASTA domain-containing Ser/Thr kinase [Streptacidiphilus jiangxiensis]|uniref:non-specific serine/threonine protein kinase n=1 Tax=Streptacidiphilus jiangxiensis TaxID=235985 RepID=A0A1H7JE80_STRJI|nr:Stk1 family PASTA domain-containing Ser/Thr kinase [Streptacidiphilus jiangxiensis]SEK72949.1 serine/threonine protein kinase [Streptacidiphilus jiangxiensis]